MPAEEEPKNLHKKWVMRGILQNSFQETARDCSSSLERSINWIAWNVLVCKKQILLEDKKLEHSEDDSENIKMIKWTILFFSKNYLFLVSKSWG